MCVPAHRCDLPAVDMADAPLARLGAVGASRGVGTGRGPERNDNSCPQFRDCVRMVHLKRDFQKCVDRGGSAVAIGQAGLKAVEDVFRLWRDFRQRQVSRADLHTGLEAVIQELQEALEQGRTCADPKVATFCTNVLALYPALWLFATVEGVEPTNNHIERLLRPGVLWRKNAFGNHREAGCRLAERILAVVQTLRLQKRQVVDYLHQALVAHRSGQPAPKLLMTTGD